MSKGNPMLTMIAKFRQAARDRARFRQIRDQINRMPPDVARDFHIFPGDAPHIAHRMVYGTEA